MQRRRVALRAALRRTPPGWRAPAPVAIEAPRSASPFRGGTPVVWERVRLSTEAGELGAVTVLLASPVAQVAGPKPAVLILHPTGKCKEFIAEHLERYAQKGFVAAAFDARYHGERALPGAGLPGTEPLCLAALGPQLLEPLTRAEAERLQVYYAALVRAWKEGAEKPFLFDSTWDGLQVLDYLSTRPDVNRSRIGVTGISLGGMHSWLLAAADERVAAAAPALGVQGFRHAVDHDLWGARVDSIRPVFDAAAQDLGRPLDGVVVEAVWKRLVPGLADAGAGGEAPPGAFDAPLSLGCIAPRPLLVVSGERDPRCPIEGVRAAVAAGAQEYAARGKPDAIALFVQDGIGHAMTKEMWKEIDTFMEAHLLEGVPSQPSKM